MQANACMSSSTSAYTPGDGALLFSEMDDDNQRPKHTGVVLANQRHGTLEEDEPLSNDWTFGGLWPHQPHWAAKGQDALLPRASPSGQ